MNVRFRKGLSISLIPCLNCCFGGQNIFNVFENTALLGTVVKCKFQFSAHVMIKRIGMGGFLKQTTGKHVESLSRQ